MVSLAVSYSRTQFPRSYQRLLKKTITEIFVKNSKECRARCIEDRPMPSGHFTRVQYVGEVRISLSQHILGDEL